MSMTRLCFFWSGCTRRLWFYPALCSLLSVLAVLPAALLDDIPPSYNVPAIDRNMLSGLLAFIAPTMLTISAFSLSILYGAFSFTSSNNSPRATDVLIADTKAHEAISALVAAFIFSLVAIMALGLGYYQSSGRLILLPETNAVPAFVILAFLRWLRTLSLFGGLDILWTGWRLWRTRPCASTGSARRSATCRAADWPGVTARLRETLDAVTRNCPGPLAEAARACFCNGEEADPAEAPGGSFFNVETP